MKPRSLLLFPPADLASCVFAAIVRDTRGAALDDAERFNHFPASPLVSVTLVIEGALHLVPTGCPLMQARATPATPKQTVVPPQEGPVSSWSPEGVAVVTVGFYPEAWAKLEAGGGAQDISNALKQAFDGMQVDEDIESRWSELVNLLGPVWQDVRASGGLADWSGSTRLTDWSRSIMGRAAMAGPGRSLRAFERRLRRWSQQSRQSLQFYADLENLHELASHQPKSLANLASDAGFADQSHMGRAVRRATGFSPARLNRMIETKEPFWCYRLLGERF